MLAIRRFPTGRSVAVPTLLPLGMLLLSLVVDGCGADAASAASATDQDAVAIVTPLPTTPATQPVTMRVFAPQNRVQPSPYPPISQLISSP